jgi:hypothetical protein
MTVMALLCLPGLGRVKAPIWDETYYIASTARFHEGRTQFASHPPLGIMLIAAGDMASGLNKGADWQAIGANRAVPAEAMPTTFDYRGPRLAPALFGVIAAGLFCLLMTQLTGSARAGAVLSLLFVADTALLVQVRSAQLDSFQIAFVLAALLAALAAWRGGKPVHFALFGLFIACAALVRANGLVTGALGLVLLWPAFQRREWALLLRQAGAGAAGGLAALALTFTAFYAFSPLPPDPATPVGQDNARFLSPAHAAALRDGGRNLGAALQGLGDYRRYMANDLAITPAADANGSHPAEWLLARGTILYRADRRPGHDVLIGLVPNLAAWLVSLLGVLTSLLPSRLRGDSVRAMLLAAWIANMAVLQYLDGMRVLYLYHYFIPLLLGHAMAAREWQRHGLPLLPAGVVAVLVAGAGAAALGYAT